MEIFLWLLLLLRVLSILAPYLLGIAGGLAVIRFVGPGIPPGCTFVLFFSVVAGIVYGIKNMLPDK